MAEDVPMAENVPSPVVSGSSSSKQKELLDIMFDRDDLPVGPNSAKLASRSGDIARTQVPISFERWDKVPKEIKDDIWNLVTKEYKLPQWYKQRWLMGLSEPWRKYKTKLRHEFLDLYDSIEEQLKYRPEGIRKEVWADFVNNEAKPGKKDSRKRNSTNRGGVHLYHTSGRRSHANVAYKMNLERKGGPPVTRNDVWIASHTHGDGSVDDEVAPIMQTVKRYKADLGEEGCRDIRNDPLRRALGREGKGFTRGVGRIPSTHYIASMRAKEKMEEMIREGSAKDDIINKLVSDVEDMKGTLGDLKELCTRLHIGIGSTPPPPPPPPPQPQPPTGSVSSSSINKSNTVASDQISNTSLYRLLDGRRQIVAHGNVMTDASQVHGVFVADDEVKVRIVNIFLPTTTLTSPNSFASTVDDVGIGGYTTWLKSRVVIKPINEKI